MTKEQIKIAAMELDPVDRSALAEELLLSIDGAEREAVDAAWLDEAHRRDADLAMGRSGAKSVDVAIASIKRKRSS
jgi:hypothetical protein